MEKKTITNKTKPEVTRFLGREKTEGNRKIAQKVFKIVKKEEPFLVTQAPFVRSVNTVSRKMGVFILALSPLLGVAFFERGSLFLPQLGHAVLAAFVFEIVGSIIFKRPLRFWNGNVILLALAFLFLIPQQVTWWGIWFALFFGIFLGRESLGGLGKYRLHPSILALLSLTIFFPEFFLRFSTPMNLMYPAIPQELSINPSVLFFKGSEYALPQWPICVGALYLLAKKAIRWQTPFVYLASIAVLSFVLGKNPLVEILSGSILLVAFFVLTEWSSSPLTGKAQALYALIAGVITEVSRTWVGSPEAVILGVLAAQMFTPVLDRYIRIRSRA